MEKELTKNFFTLFVKNMKILANNYKYQIDKYKYCQQNQKNFSFRGTDLLDLPDNEVIKKIKESVNSENFLGQGTEAQVYRIKDTDYCVRIPHVSTDVYLTKYDKNVSPAEKINHVKVKLGFGASIMRYIEGIIPKLYKNNESSRDKLQSEIADMPVKSYTDLLHQIANATNNNLLFDYSGGNLIVDKKHKKLTAIDFSPMPIDNPRPVNPLNEMFQALTCYGTKKETSKKICKKIILAGIDEFKSGVTPCMNLELFNFKYLLSKNENVKDLEKFEQLFNKLKEIKKQEITDKTFSKQLDDTIKRLVKLIKSIR